MSYLTPTEQCLLDYLVANRGRIVPYAELIGVLVAHREAPTEVESFNRERLIRILRQYISRLRKKIENDPALPDLIITHRGEGYSFEGRNGDFVQSLQTVVLGTKIQYN